MRVIHMPAQPAGIRPPPASTLAVIVILHDKRVLPTELHNRQLPQRLVVHFTFDPSFDGLCESISQLVYWIAVFP